MKRKSKILAFALICAMPLGLFAYNNCAGHKVDKENYNNAKQNFYHYEEMAFEKECEFEDDSFITYEFIEKKGINLSFEGIVQLKPKKGFNGVWTISGKEVIVDDKTIISMEEELKITDEVAVLAKRENGEIKAILIEVD